MAQLLIRRLDEDVKENLRKRATRHGVSMEEEARSILRAELLRGDPGEFGLGSRIARMVRDIPDNDEPFELLPDESFRPAQFDE